jgi:hypothetical protein
LPESNEGLFAAGLMDPDGVVWAVAMACNPPPAWQGTGRVVIGRVASAGAPNGCSMLYAALCRAAQALGYVEAWTYTLDHEPGTSLKAAGFEDMGFTDEDAEWNRAGRPRRAAVCPGAKRRWRRVLDAKESPRAGLCVPLLEAPAMPDVVAAQVDLFSEAS